MHGQRLRWLAIARVHNAEHRWHEQQGGTGGEEQAADHGAAERRILAGLDRHRDHADDHRERGHEDRPGAAVTGSAPSASRSRAKLITRMLLAVATPMHMIAPVSAGTESVVLVANSIQTMPASAVGSATTITNGSSQDWKLTTISR